jgi:hypothetical protein
MTLVALANYISLLFQPALPKETPTTCNFRHYPQPKPMRLCHLPEHSYSWKAAHHGVLSHRIEFERVDRDFFVAEQLPDTFESSIRLCAHNVRVSQ